MSEKHRSPALVVGPDPSKNLFRKVVIGTLLGAMVFAGLSLYADINALGTHLRSFRWSYFIAALALTSGNYGLRYLRWHYYLREVDIHVPHGQSLLIFLSGFVMSVTPGKLGEVFKSLLLFEYHEAPITRTAPLVFAERLTDLLALVLLTSFGCLSFDQGVPIALGGAFIVALFLFASAYRPVGEFLLRLSARIPLLQKITPRLREAYESLFTMTRPRPLLFATALATLGWSLECVALWLLLRGFEGQGLGWAATFFAYSASTIAGALAMMPGGLGVTEAGMTSLLLTLSGGALSSSVATGATMLTRLATLWWAVLVGALALGLLRARFGRPQSTKEEAPQA